MRAVIVVAIALLAVAYAAEVETEVATEAEVEANVPILPGLGMGCLEKKVHTQHTQSPSAVHTNTLLPPCQCQAGC
jgi:hypothetical protein